MAVGRPPATHPGIMWVVRLTWAQEWKVVQPSGVVFSWQPTKSVRLHAQCNRITAILGLRIGLGTCPNSTFMCWGGNRIIDSSMSASATLGGAVLWRRDNHLASHVDLLHGKRRLGGDWRWWCFVLAVHVTVDSKLWRARVGYLASQPPDYKEAAVPHAGIMHLSIPVVRGSKRITHHLSANFPLCRLLFEMAAFSSRK